MGPADSRPDRARPPPARCFPYAGAGASVFRGWGAGLPEGVEAFAVQLPGREDRFIDQPIADLEELLDVLLRCPDSTTRMASTRPRGADWGR
ncbi:thioesterase domain-containing protein [Kitasatospora sp. NPDC092039]|uniref:thioesterase domain-containing protein n=1 Tax=Kitasatospora sp. NPDC092039 TaxID=3364086 RepID=UPI00381D2A3E